MGGRIFKDTSNIFAIDYGDIVQVGGKSYLIKGHEREDRFGLDEPKFWVKKAVDVDTGERKILKLSFFETFEASIGDLKIPCFRNPEKEGAVLNLVGNHPYFMHGSQHSDTKGNNVRVLDVVKGINFYRYIESITMDHERYFHELLPDILQKLIKAFDALRILHKAGFRHGDVRNDHIIIEQGTGNYVWIDFDYDYDLAENPFSLDLIGIGNILLYSIGKGFHNLKEREQGGLVYQELISKAERDDFSIIHKWRFMNLKKLYPYIPNNLNDILRHFTYGASIFYESVDEVLEDLNRCITPKFS
ncbi:MAG: aminoglycoside phosphotransferase family protein [Proteobacteria bacterium]|nr:aminoglycoside phosphotransferase family protein [Pseudomonadota bacterium]